MPKFSSAPLVRPTDFAGYRSRADAARRRSRGIRAHSPSFSGTLVRVPIKGAQRQIDLMATRKSRPLPKWKAVVYKSIIRFLNVSIARGEVPAMEDIVSTVYSDLKRKRIWNELKIPYTRTAPSGKVHTERLQFSVGFVDGCCRELIRKGLIEQHEKSRIVAK